MRLLFIVLFGICGANAATHRLQYFYTATTGIKEFPRFVDVGMLNGEVISMYDSNLQRKVPKQRWMAENLDQQYWDRYTEIVKATEQAFFNNIQVAMSRFNQTAGVHTFQQMYGCEWDDQTGVKGAFRQTGYDGEDFVALDFKEMRFISPMQQGIPTVQKWNNDIAGLEYFKNYYSTECIEWLQKYVVYGKSSLEKTVSPQVSLLQKSASSPVVCHVTGFYPSGIKISWQKNGQDYDEDVDLSELNPNADGSFQKTSTLKIKPEEWKKDKFSCVVEHQGKTINSILTENEIRTNNPSAPLGIIIGIVVAAVLLMVIAVAGFVVYRKKNGFKQVSGSDDGSNSSTHTVPKA